MERDINISSNEADDIILTVEGQYESRDDVVVTMTPEEASKVVSDIQDELMALG